MLAKVLLLGSLSASVVLVPLSSSAEEDANRQELLEMKNTVMNLVDALVEEGIIDPAKADALKERARAQAAVDARQELIAEKQANENVVRVPYVPEFVREEIKQEVREGVREDVLADVEAKARDEKWGTPDALPEWVNKFSWYGDFRVRFDYNRFDENNPTFSLTPGFASGTILNYQAINEARSIGTQDAFFNFSDDRERLRGRLRLGFDIAASDSVTLGARLATGENPVSRNIDLGESWFNQGITLDAAFMAYRVDEGLFGGALGDVTLLGGKFFNPFVSTELVWDADVNLTGLAATYSNGFHYGDDAVDSAQRTNGWQATFGVFPLSLAETPIPDDGNSNDKWLIGMQLAMDRRLNDDTMLMLSGAYYNYNNIQGQPTNVAGDFRNFWTAPGFVQKGNTMIGLTPTFVDPVTAFGLATDYRMLNIVGALNFTHFAPYEVDLTAAYVNNLGYDANDIRGNAARIPFFGPSFDFDRRNQGYELSAYGGHPEVEGFMTWRVGGRYVYLEADATLDAYANSNFQLGGTNYKGWQIDAMLGLSEATFARLRYFSTNEITEVPLGIDVLLLDLQTNF